MTTRARNLSPQLLLSWVRWGPLEERAWAWQERHCATRIISFTDGEAKWKCTASVGCECLGALQPLELRQPDFNNGIVSILCEWREVVCEYARRSLTYNTDRLPAIAGIASRFHDRLGGPIILLASGKWSYLTT
jgi:hypothetical protein